MKDWRIVRRLSAWVWLYTYYSKWRLIRMVGGWVQNILYRIDVAWCDWRTNPVLNKWGVNRGWPTPHYPHIKPEDPTDYVRRGLEAKASLKKMGIEVGNGQGK